MARKKINDRHFQKLAENIKYIIEDNEGLIGDQQAQVEKLVNLERKFRNDISKYSQAVRVYRNFISFINDKEDGLGNILKSQSYFRESSKNFSSNISPAIRAKDPQALMKFDINYQLIKYISDNWEGDLPERSQRYYTEILETRNILIENNLPLAINRAKIFYSKTPKSHLGLLDLIDICVCGLIAGVDKYTGDYRKVWASVSIGRMVGFMIEEYSKSFINLYPKEKKILYRANALRHRMKIDNIKDLTDAVNESFLEDKEKGKRIPKLPITEIQITTLMNGSNYISVDSKLSEEGEDEEGVGIYDYTPHPDMVEDIVEKKDAMEHVTNACTSLEVIERKVIRLKGVEL